MQAIEVNGFRIAYQRRGQGPALVLLHGFIHDSRTWHRQIEDLSRDFDVIAWDAPGCGQSSDPPEEFSMAEFADCLGGFLDAEGISAAHLVGLSWGGTLAMEFYRQRPEAARSLVLADTYAGWTGSLGAEAAKQRLEQCINDSRKPPEDWIPEWAPHAFSDNASTALWKEQESHMWDFHAVGFRAMSRAVAPDFREIFPLVSVPTLLIWGDDDKRSPLSAGEMMRDGIKGSRLVVIPSAGHVSNLEQPERFNAEVRAFIMGFEE